MAIHHMSTRSEQPLDGNKLRQYLLETVAACNAQGPDHLQSGTILRQVADRLNDRQKEKYGQLILTLLHDLFRTGYLAWGSNLESPDPPNCHLTAQGRETLKTLSRDPANPAGYLEHLHQQTTLAPVALSYLTEGLHTYNSGCHKATAVMVGAAAESLILGLRDLLEQGLVASGVTPVKKLRDWRAKTVCDAVSEVLGGYRAKMPIHLRELFDGHWPALATEIRTARNDAGHPSSIDPITPERSHAALLLFPLLAKLVADLGTWVQENVK